ncbi:uncharacterized protein LOC142355585 [Convolutriloba macropyga]|uniref:uncharacterized protein LOC142355585 n=1 Tax=Convolutriloba macropyga TaxID=536237 RepID=UPI003F51EA32
MLWTTTEKRQRVPQLGDRDEFWNFTINSYSRYNWFSFNDNDAGHCCYYQVSMYLLEGRSNGFTPAEYHEKITDFRSGSNKQLNFIGVEYDPLLCINVISQVGFGIGDLFIDGANDHIPSFMIPRGRRESVFVFTRQSIEYRLTFDWFKMNYICRDQPWICTMFAD